MRLIDHLVSPFYVPSTTDAFNPQHCMNFSLHVAHIGTFICLEFFKKTTVIKKSYVSVNESKPER